MSWLGRTRASDLADEGFTLIEMIVAVALSAIVLVALAGGLGGGLRALAVQKARTQGNEVATLGIESLQSLSYDALGVCVAAAGAPPSLANTTPPPAGACTGTEENDLGWGEQPCRTSLPSSGVGFVRATYKCTRNNVTYDVRRFVAWGDDAQMSKRLAVFVKWRDTVGEHEVSQQSSLRAPGAQDIAGLPTPQLSGLIVNGSAAPGSATLSLNPGGDLAADAPLQVTTSGLTAGASSTTGDKVYTTFSVLDATDTPDTISVFLSSTNGSNWTGSIPAGTRFGNGTQYFTFATIRAADGKGNALASPKVTFTGATTGASPAPTFVSWSATPSGGGTDVRVTSSGGLIPTAVNLAATTTNSSPTDSVTVLFQTRTGAVSARLSNVTCSTGTCSWQGSILQESGYSFTVGTKKMYFTIAQPFTVPGTGSTAAEERTVTFTL